MKFLNYDQLIEHIKQKPTQNEQLEEIIKYFMDNVQYDYVMIEHINEIITLKFTKYADLLFPNVNEKLRNKAISFLRNSSNISNAYWERLRNLYLTPSIDENGEAHYISLTDALTSLEPEHIINNGLLEKGMSSHIAEFAKKLCDDVGIKAIIIKGISNGKMKHFWLNICIDDKELFYDIAYALYIRDNFCGMGKRYSPAQWLGISPKQLYKNQPTRVILHPQGFDLEYLGLNNLPLCMKDFFINVT